MQKPTILDDPARIMKIDKSNMLSFCVDASKHYSNAAKLAGTARVDFDKPQTIIVAGMGGSGIGGELLKDWTRDRIDVPLEVCREYSLPMYADKNTLVFVVSYSGETEETLSVLLDAIKKRCMIFCVSSGGKIHEVAERMNLPSLQVPKGMMPRATLPYLFMPTVAILGKLGMVPRAEAEISETIEILKQISDENSPERQSSSNFSKSLAMNIRGTIPVFYGSGAYRSSAQRLKTQINENSKTPAKWEFFPELNHNEVVGWERAETFVRRFSAIFLRDHDEPTEIRQRIEITKELMCGRKLHLFEIWGRGKSMLAKMSSVICTGDFTSVYLAILRGIDPTPVKTITVLKERLKSTGIRENVVRELIKIVEK